MAREPANSKKNGNGANLGFEADLFKTADKLRGNMEPSDYKHVAEGGALVASSGERKAVKHRQADRRGNAGHRKGQPENRTNCSQACNQTSVWTGRAWIAHAPA
jgi:hypothetical protein